MLARIVIILGKLYYKKFDFENSKECEGSGIGDCIECDTNDG